MNRHGFGRTAVLAALAAGFLVAPSLGADTGTRRGVSQARCRRTRSNSRPPQASGSCSSRQARRTSSTAPAIRSSFFGLQAAAAAIPGVDGIVNDPTDDTPENTRRARRHSRRRPDALRRYNNSGPGGFSGLSRSPTSGRRGTTSAASASRRSRDRLRRDPRTFYYAEIATIGGQTRSASPAPPTTARPSAQRGRGRPASGGVGGDTTTLSDKPWIASTTPAARTTQPYIRWTRFFDNTGDGRRTGASSLLPLDRRVPPT